MRLLQMRLGIATFIFLIFLSFPVMGVVCESPGLDTPFPGWEMRFNGTVNTSSIIEDGYRGVFGMGDLSVKVVKIFSGGVVNVEISKKGDKIGTFSVPKRVNYNDFLSLQDIRIWANSVGSNTANLSIFTHDRAVLNITATLDYHGSRNFSFPGEEVDLDIEVKNIGELEAKDISLSENFGDIEVVSAEELPVSSMCPDSGINLSYKIKAPKQLREGFNYTISFDLDYNDYNNQLLIAKTHHKRIPLDIIVKTLKLSLEKSSGDWTLANLGRELRVTNTIKNNGNTSAFNIQLIDVPPFDFEVVSGTTSRRIYFLDPGKEKEFTYSIISNDPIICKTMSKITYDDEFGNNYTQISGLANTTFSPALKVTKTFRSKPFVGFDFEYPFKTRRSMRSNFSREVVEEVLTLLPVGNGTGKKAMWKRFGDKNVSIERGGTDVTVEVENIGNAVAYDLNMSEVIKGNFTNKTPPLEFEGATSWNGSLQPGSRASYNFTVYPTGHIKDIKVSTNIRFKDVDGESLNNSYFEDIAGYLPGVCTKKLVDVSRNLSATYMLSVPSAKVTLTSPGNLSKNDSFRVYEDSRFTLDITIQNNGTERVYDLEVELDTGNFTLIKGQQKTFYESLDSGKNISSNITLWSPSIEKLKSFNVTALLKYVDIYGEERESASTILIEVHPAKGAFIIVRAERTNLSLTLNYANESQISEPVEFNIGLRNIGFGVLGNITFNMSLPKWLEVVTNDTRWAGRIEAEIRVPTQTFYALTGNLSWNGNLSVGEKITLPLKLSGARAGFYKIPYVVEFDGKSISGDLDFKVNGPILSIKKTVKSKKVIQGGGTDVSVVVKNIGDLPALMVLVKDVIPIGLIVTGETRKNASVFGPGEELVLKYSIVTNDSGSFDLGGASVVWMDALSNFYVEESERIILTVTEIATPTPPQQTTAPPETTPPLTPPPTIEPRSELIEWVQSQPKEAFSAALLTVVVIAIMIKLLTLSWTIKE